MSEYRLPPDENIDVSKILEDLEHYRPRRRGWTWREPAPNLTMGPFTYHDCSKPLVRGVPLPPAHNFDNVDPQPMPVITTEIASGRFEDDIRRMRMAAHHGADHIMVIRTSGQSHFDGLIEGTPQGVGGVPISRKQVRAQRKRSILLRTKSAARSTTTATSAAWRGRISRLCLPRKASTAAIRTRSTT